MLTQVFVHPNGDDANDGSSAHPLRSVRAGVLAVSDGGSVTLRGGTYFGDVELDDVRPTQAAVVIRSMEGERAVLESSLPEFRGSTPNHAWKSLGGGEYVSVKPIRERDPVHNRVRGAFRERDPYTRLISYDRLEDLLAPGETFPKVLPTDPGFAAFDGNLTTKGFKRPWVYMGPGVWLDATAHVHIRLSHTHNSVPRWADYDEATDPTQLRLAISPRLTAALTLRRCANIEIRDLDLRYGGEHTVSIRACSDILFDHVDIRAGSQAVRLDKDDLSSDGCTTITLRDCRIDGGIPTWFFRSDRKDGYEVAGSSVTDDLGAATSGTCISGNDVVPHVGMAIEQCEIVNVHDVAVFGRSPRYHHNLLDNVNDDALLIIGGTDDALVHHNVLTRVLTVLSLADTVPSKQVSVFRNLIDLRTPTLGIRPGLDGPGQSLRFGQFYKSNEVEGPIDIFQNTCVVLNAGSTTERLSQGNTASFTHYRHLSGGTRRAVNNIFVGIYSAGHPAKPVAFLPPSTFAGPTDGNVYHRFPVGPDLILVPKPDASGGFVASPDLVQYRASQAPYERRGRTEDPSFRSVGVDGLARPSDDFRLSSESPAKRSGAFLTGWMRIHDGIPINQVDTELSRPDIGCYPNSDEPLAVGVGRRHVFPAQD